ncbi:MAG TPA: DUF58 domain-containing protein [Deinococcales bacterium]|nr:DUF58 domain-containing protein [Deinococcales bacterium]
MPVRGYRLASRALAWEGGERRASLAGPGGEFLDYRPYHPGDEPRHVDWNVYARSGRLYTRQYRAERSTRVYLALDESASMRPKEEGARSVARMLRDFARSDTWHERRLPDLATGLPTLARDKPGLVLLVSDGLEPLPGIRTALLSLASRGFDLSFLQVLSRDDVEPPPGPWRLRDAEGAGEREVDDGARRTYLQRLQRHLEGLAATTKAIGLRHAQVMVPATNAEVWHKLRRAGILERGS